jgi:hypothetical protein
MGLEQWPQMGSLSIHQISTDRMTIDSKQAKHMEKCLSMQFCLWQVPQGFLSIEPA